MAATRGFWTIVHRWSGLSIALFLVVVALTGSVLAFEAQLQPLLAPRHYAPPPSATARPLDWLALHGIAERLSGGVIHTLPLHRRADEAAIFAVAARPGRPPLGFDEIVLDPYGGHEIERARSGDLADGSAQILPFVLLLHESLVLGDWGAWLLGIVALVWTIDCFVGFYLTLPVARRRWLARWRTAWTMRLPPSSGIRLNFDLHRVGGLWLWPMLLVFAWSGVSFNLRPVYDPVMHALTGMTVQKPLKMVPATHPPRLDWATALATARHRALETMAARGITLRWERELRFDAADNSYAYAVRTSRDRSDDLGNSWFTIDGDSGRLLRVELPTGDDNGRTIDYWLGLLHEAAVFGLPYRIFVSVLGLAVATLSLTGIVIWSRKRRARYLHRRRSAPAR